MDGIILTAPRKLRPEVCPDSRVPRLLSGAVAICSKNFRFLVLRGSRPLAYSVKWIGVFPMKTFKEFLAVLLAGTVMLATSPNALAAPMYEPPYQEADQAPLTSADIDAIVSPIALYPDQLIAQILGAATYPDQVTAASNWVNSNGGLKDQALMQAVDKQPWDPSVKALTQFPTVLDQMAKNLAWTSALGDAAFNQQADVLASIQRLRKQAKDAGNLKTTPQIKVVQENPQTIVIQQANPQVVYVPSYNPTVVYGTPYNPPGYSTAALVTTGLISFGVGMAIGASMNNSCCGWGYYGGGWGCFTATIATTTIRTTGTTTGRCRTTITTATTRTTGSTTPTTTRRPGTAATAIAATP
jgi:hypothetical protein